MGNGYSPKELVAVPQVIGASQSVQVGKEEGLSAGGSIHLRVDALVSGVTVGSGITLKLQQKRFDSWADLASANSTLAITANGEYTLRLMVERAADQADMPLAKQVRLVVVTAAGAAVTVEKARLLQSL